jgi:mannose-6-phosphate isomerase-like protein (cupin superfamily)
MRSLRLQGLEAGGSEAFWVGLSHYLPGGGAGPDSAPLERVYVVLSGQLTVIVDGEETVLGPMDSCTIPSGETREAINRGNDVCTMVVVMPTPPGSAS